MSKKLRFFNVVDLFGIQKICSFDNNVFGCQKTNVFKLRVSNSKNDVEIFNKGNATDKNQSSGYIKGAQQQPNVPGEPMAPRGNLGEAPAAPSMPSRRVIFSAKSGKKPRSPIASKKAAVTDYFSFFEHFGTFSAQYKGRAATPVRRRSGYIKGLY